jgi:hypothetical protein
MTGYRIMLAAIAAVALIAVAPEAQGGGGVPITSCGQTVTASAVLMQDLNCTGAGIVVGASKIRIDLNGFVLKGDGGDPGVDDSGGFDGVAIKNGALRNFASGVNAPGADSIRISNVVASGNAIHGILVFGASASITSVTAAGNAEVGITILGASASIKSSTAAGNGDDGIHVSGASASIKSSSAAGNGNDGISVDGASASITSVTAAGNGGAGFFVIGALASIKSSIASGNGFDGILVSGDAATIKTNRAQANGFPAAASDLDGLGILVSGFTTPPVGTNTARGNDDPAECSPASLC